MVFAWIFVLIAAMVHTRATNKLKRAKKPQKKGEFVIVDDSESETDTVDWDELEKETSTPTVSTEPKRKAPVSPKAKTPPTATDKGKNPIPLTHTSMKKKSVARRKGRARGIEIEESLARDSPPPQDHVHVSIDRIKAFESRECIGERHVNVEALRIHSPDFGILIERTNLFQICKFADTVGYCLSLVRTFYANAHQLRESKDGPMEFYTMVRERSLKITPQLIGEVLGMRSSITGTHFLKGVSLTTAFFQKVVDGICMPNTQITGHSVYSKELRPEYKLLNFIVCYNILPNMQTKVLRWDRMLFLYLLGHPLEAVELNVNIPYIIWNRMARYVDHPHQPERLPFPLIIMRILQKFKVDISSTSYQHSSGTIDDSTVVKSRQRQLFDTSTPPLGKASAATISAQPAHATAAPASQRIPISDDEASVPSIYREQKRLSFEQERIVKEQGRISQELEIITAAQITLTKKFSSISKVVKKMSSKMGCSSSEDSDSD